MGSFWDLEAESGFGWGLWPGWCGWLVEQRALKNPLDLATVQLRRPCRGAWPGSGVFWRGWRAQLRSTVLSCAGRDGGLGQGPGALFAAAQ